MGGMAKSVSGFLGGSGPEVSTQTSNNGLGILGNENYAFQDPNAVNQMMAYANAGPNANITDYMNANPSVVGENEGLGNALATGALTGSKYATQQVQSNPILGQLFGDQGLMGKEIGKEQDLQNQGYQLQPQDVSMYGQASGNIARQFGQAGNDASQQLASRGLAAGPSGAAGAMFSGLQGSQNEQLAQAQQNIMQQRFQNTQQQIAQQQNMIGQLGGQAQNAIQSQYGRQLSGVQQQNQSLLGQAGAQTNQNNSANSANLGAAEFAQQNKPENFMDQSINNSNIASGAFAKGLGSMGGMMGG